MRARIKKSRFFLWMVFCFCILLLYGKGEASAQETEEKVTLRMMHFFGTTETDINSKYLREIIDNELPQVFPNVELAEEIYDNETYKSRIRVLMAADELPDIMFCYGGGFSKSFMQSGRVLAVEPYLEDFYKEHMIPEYQKNFLYDGEQYGICFAHWTGVLYCNQTLFEEAGAKIPETYDELIEACAKLRSAGIQPIACGMKNYWQGQQWVNNFTIQLGGTDEYLAMAEGDASLNNKILASAAQYTSDLIAKHVFIDNVNQIDSSTAEEYFLSGKAAMIYIGSWFTMTAEERLGDALVVTKMPSLPDAKYPEDYHGGAINGWIVSADTEYPDLAVQVSSYLAYRLGCYQPDTSSFRIEEEDQELMPDELQETIAGFYAEEAKGGAAWDTLLTTKEAKEWLSLCGKLFTGRCDGNGFALQAGVIK